MAHETGPTSSLSAENTDGFTFDRLLKNYQENGDTGFADAVRANPGAALKWQVTREDEAFKRAGFPSSDQQPLENQ